MPAYTTVATHATGDVFPATDWNSYVRDDFAFLHDQGADLASGATITPTNQFHRVTGTTTITTIAAPTGAGQGGNHLLLKFQSSGCAITAGAALVLKAPFVSVASGVIEFIWDATLAGWVEIGRANGQPGVELDYKQITANVAIGSGATVTVITGNAVTYDGVTRVKIEAIGNASGASTAGSGPVVYIARDGTQIGAIVTNGGNCATTGLGAIFETPTAGSHTYSVQVANTSASATYYAGLGGVGAVAPAYLRVTTA